MIDLFAGGLMIESLLPHVVRVAAYQGTPSQELWRRHEQFTEILARADQAGADFVCLPEGFLTGYFENYLSAYESALAVGSPELDAWIALSAPFRTTAIVGFNELCSGKLFDSAAVIESGRLIGIQRKHHLYHRYFEPGQTFEPFCSKSIMFGVIICRDCTYFEPARILALKDASILFCPMCNVVPSTHPYRAKPLYYSHFAARSYENRCWFIAADWTSSWDTANTSPGHSAIYDTNGMETSRLKEDAEGLLIQDIPKESLSNNKHPRVRGSPALVSELLLLQSPGSLQPTDDRPS